MPQAPGLLLDRSYATGQCSHSMQSLCVYHEIRTHTQRTVWHHSLGCWCTHTAKRQLLRLGNLWYLVVTGWFTVRVYGVTLQANRSWRPA